MSRAQFTFQSKKLKDAMWEFRVQNKHTQTEAAMACKFKREKYYRLESGKQKPSAIELAVICNYILKSPAYFYGPNAITDAKEAH